MIKINEINTKSIIQKSNLPATDYVVNPYIGCQHGCLYCYAEFMKRFTNHHENWGSFVDAKINAASTITHPSQYYMKRVLFGSVTDAYQPIEGKYKITRDVLSELIAVQPKLEILTKSALVLRDLDIIKQFKDVTVGVSISTIDNKISRQLEPYASPPLKRLDVLKRCKEVGGIRTYCFISPIIPFITDVSKIMESFIPYSDFFMFENLNIRPTNIKKMITFLERISINLPTELKKIYSKNSKYWEDEESKLKLLCENRGIEAYFFFHHSKK